ncbi:hypothetical protein A2Y85_00985 [candidate division WOR-3 bacterium RBG_13_43_14]|uniref:Glycerophosphoryl diester phosphodiesterase membrane domain-containing protein n=1 Tax=candidate division WOR-3 bacterium RBG_13_43_14 TaxID=1802590 RepID=A0A1F4UB37_UNCW3|nr:MAG: hypothetical protein A2Y85_00985 [candidate division WOR-3 bacterium RBG_13_43_14]
MTNLHFNYKDIFRAGRLGFSAKKMWLAFLGSIVGFIGYTLFSYLAYISAGIEIGEIWETFRLLPMYPMGLQWFCWLFWIVGFLWLTIVCLLTGVAISKVTYEQLKGDEFYEIKEAIKFTFKHGKSAILAPIILVLFIAMLVVMGIILSAITWIPYVGQLFFALMAIPAFAVSLFILYLVIVIMVSIAIGPSIVGCTGNDTFDTLFESFSVINDQPWRFIVYQFLLKLVMITGIVILGFFAAKAIFLCHDIIDIVVPSAKLDNIFMNAAHYVKISIPALIPSDFANLFVGYVDTIGMPNLLFPPPYMTAYQGFTGAITSFLLGIIYYLIILFVASLGLSIYWAGNTLIFTVLVKKKDDKNLLEIKDEPIEETKIDEPSTEGKDENDTKATEPDEKVKKPRKKKETDTSGE